MALFNITESSAEFAKEMVNSLGQVGLWLQAIGLLVIITIITLVISLIIAQKRLKQIRKIKKQINSIEDKLDKVLKKRK